MKKLGKLFKRKKILFIAIVIAFFTVLIVGFLFLKYQKAPADEPEATELIKKVSRFILLPEDEVPTIATVSDYEKLKEQQFFQKSQNGDKVLIYTIAKKAYLYRPSTDKLIDVTVVNVDTPNPTLAQVKVVLRNGTLSTGLANRFESVINGLLANITIVKKENAAKNDYQKTTLVVFNENALQTASILADYLKVSVSSLPADESKPDDADILLIIGKDKISL